MTGKTDATPYIPQLYSYEIRLSNDPPLNQGRHPNTAQSLELLTIPHSTTNRVFLYAVWADGFKYLQSWPQDLLSMFLAAAEVEPENKGREWTPTLHKQLTADYNCPVRIRRRAQGYQDDRDSSIRG